MPTHCSPSPQLYMKNNKQNESNTNYVLGFFYFNTIYCYLNELEFIIAMSCVDCSNPFELWTDLSLTTIKTPHQCATTTKQTLTSGTNLFQVWGNYLPKTMENGRAVIGWLRLDLSTVGCLIRGPEVKHSHARPKALGLNPVWEVVDAHCWGTHTVQCIQVSNGYQP